MKGVVTEVLQWQLAVQPLDMRAGMDSVVARVVQVFGQVQVQVAYAFTNSRRTRMKVLINDGFGLWLCTRRLSRCGGGSGFVWPSLGAKDSVQLEPLQWQALTVGLDWRQVNRSITVV